MAIWKKEEIKTQLDKVDMLNNARKYYTYKSGDEAKAAFEKISADFEHEVKMLLIITLDWSESYRKNSVGDLREYFHRYHENPIPQLAFQILGYIKTIMS